MKALKEFGHRLLQQKHSAKETIETKLQRLEELRKNLTQVWEERRHILTQCRDLQVLYYKKLHILFSVFLLILKVKIFNLILLYKPILGFFSVSPFFTFVSHNN